jgi:hypothetical protein
MEDNAERKEMALATGGNSTKCCWDVMPDLFEMENIVFSG